MQPHMRRSVAGTLVNYFTPFIGHVEKAHATTPMPISRLKHMRIGS